MNKYDAIARDLSALIDTKQPGDRIPSEQELAATYGVSAMTVRRAIQLLTSSGRIEGIRGRGTFVRAPTVRKALTASSSFSETMRASGRVPSSRLLSASISPATDAERTDLGLGADEAVLHIRRIRFGDDMPLCLEDAALPADKFPGLLGQDLETSLYATLRSRYQTDVIRTKFEVEAVHPDPQEAEQLHIDKTTPCLRTHTLGQDQHGQIVERTISLYRGDIYRLTFEGGPSTG